MKSRSASPRFAKCAILHILNFSFFMPLVLNKKEEKTEDYDQKQRKFLENPYASNASKRIDKHAYDFLKNDYRIELNIISNLELIKFVEEKLETQKEEKMEDYE
jgi:hypothetical protein